MSTVIIVTGLGGGTGTGAAPAILALARSLGLDVIVAATLPFKFETERREVALNGLAELHLEEERLVLLDHAESLNNLGVHQKTLLEVFEESAKNIADEVYRLLTCRFP